MTSHSAINGARLSDAASRQHAAFWVCLALGVLPLCAAAEPMPAPAKAEVVASLKRLETSGCQFSRNGTWYSGAQASAHLLKKLDVAEGRRAMRSAEEFIAVVATKSSATGEPYKVRCGTEAPMPSAKWLLQELQQARATGPKSPSK